MTYSKAISMAARRQNLNVLLLRTRKFYNPIVRRGLSSATPLLVEEEDNNHQVHHHTWTRKNHGELKKIMLQQQQHQISAQLTSNAPSAAAAVDDSVLPDVDEEESEARLADGDEEGQFRSKVDTRRSPTELTYTGDATIPITTQLHIVTPGEEMPSGVWPIFRLMDEDGTFRDGSADGFRFKTRYERVHVSKHIDHQTSETQILNDLREELKGLYPNHVDEIEQNGLLFPAKHSYADIDSTDTLLRAYTQMIRLREMDYILQNAQRQGRISFYMTCHGEEAIHIGSASALEPQDVVLAQYREAGLLMWRGFTLEQFTDQCFSNKADLGKGRQMPVHYGSRALNYQTISSPLGTQIPQAAGVGYRLKLAGKDAVATCFFGDGCASTTDFHSGLNFAATLNAPVIFFCRNNGYAISTSVVDQYRGDGIVSRAPGYGMAGIRVDGNDIFAVHAAVREARAYALKNNAPILIEAMTYRQGHHSTSDDSLRYRSAKEIQTFADKNDPVNRLRKFLERHNWHKLTEKDYTRIQDSEKMDVIDAMRQAEQKPKPPVEELFTDVYHEIPPFLAQQQKELHAHMKKYPTQY